MAAHQGIIDDGTDDSGAVDSALAQTSSDLEILTVRDPKEALDRARGEFLFFLRASERLMPWAVEVLASILRRDARIAFVFAGAQAIGARSIPRRYSRLGHLLGEYVACPAMLRVRDLHRAGGIDASFPALFELDLTLRMAEVQARGTGRAVVVLAFACVR